MPGFVLRAERFVFNAVNESVRRKVFQCQFSQRDGSIFVSFPYYRGTVGLVSHVTWPAGQPTATLNPEVGGKVTSHLVKYSHHPDGRAHFSQDGKVRTLVKKQAIPLADIEGHLFSLHVEGLEHFDLEPGNAKGSQFKPQRHSVNFMFASDMPTSLKFVGWLYSDRQLEERSVTGLVHSKVRLVGPDGRARHGFVCSTLPGAPGHDRCLIVSCERSPRLSVASGSSLVFVAGFDAGEAMDNTLQPVSFLAVSYPAENPEEIKKRIGSIDLELASTCGLGSSEPYKPVLGVRKAGPKIKR